MKTTYLREPPISESRLYFRLVRGMVALGCVIILSGFDQPIILLVISACTGGAIMCIYSFLLIRLNRRALPSAIGPGPLRIGALVWATLFFGVLSALTIWQQLQRFM